MSISKTKKSVYADNELQQKIKSTIDQYLSLKKWYVWVGILVARPGRWCHGRIASIGNSFIPMEIQLL
jgi:hypothetical protein